VRRGDEQQNSCSSPQLTRKYIKPVSVLWPKKVAEPKKKRNASFGNKRQRFQIFFHLTLK
jgi:hypothetical protein